MSIIQNEKKELTIKPMNGHMDWEDVANRVDALIWAIQCIDEDMHSPERMYVLACVLEDYLPTREQWKKLYSKQ